jgi:hypothetical protein
MVRDIGELNGTEMDYGLLLDIRKKANALAGKRHLLAHSLWTHDKQTNDWCALITRGSWSDTQEEIENYPNGSKAVQPEARAVSASEVAEWTTQTVQLIEDLKKLGDQHRVVPLPPSPKKQRSQSRRRNPTRGQDG